MPYAHLRPSGTQNDKRLVQISDHLDLVIALWILGWISIFIPNTVGQILPDTSALRVSGNCNKLTF